MKTSIKAVLWRVRKMTTVLRTVTCYSISTLNSWNSTSRTNFQLRSGWRPDLELAFRELLISNSQPPTNCHEARTLLKTGQFEHHSRSICNCGAQFWLDRNFKTMPRWKKMFRCHYFLRAFPAQITLKSHTSSNEFTMWTNSCGALLEWFDASLLVLVDKHRRRQIV